MKQLIDRFQRAHNSLRISLTGENNMYCVYYDPSLSSTPNKNMELLSYENILRLIRIFVSELGITEIKFTGGEPLDRENVFGFFQKLSEFNKQFNIELGLISNGLALYDNIEKLVCYGINKININLNTLKKNKFKKIYPGFDIEYVLKSINKAEECGINPLKINCVVMKGFNDDEILDFVDFVKERNVTVRFIEILPFTDKWGVNSFMSIEQIYKKINSVYNLVKLKTNILDIAKNYRIKDYSGTVGLISFVSNHYCSSCNRLRITANGNLIMCLFSYKNKDINLKSLLNSEDLSDKEIAGFISDQLYKKDLHHPDVEKLLLLNKSNLLNIKQ